MWEGKGGWQGGLGSCGKNFKRLTWHFLLHPSLFFTWLLASLWIPCLWSPLGKVRTLLLLFSTWENFNCGFLFSSYSCRHLWSGGTQRVCSPQTTSSPLVSTLPSRLWIGTPPPWWTYSCGQWSLLGSFIHLSSSCSQSFFHLQHCSFFLLLFDDRDIAGHERFGCMTHVYYKYAIAAVVVFDLTRPATFDAVLKWKDDLDSKVVLNNQQPVPCILLANKVGLSSPLWSFPSHIFIKSNQIHLVWPPR